jgi:hypothetical protein
MVKVKKELSEKRHSNDIFRMIALVFILVVVSYAVFVQYEKIVKKKMLEEKCDAIEKSPDLLVSCDCFPTPEKKSTGDYVENRTEAFCTCVCDIGENQTYTIEVRIAR